MIDDNRIEVILPSGDIPLGSVVRKPTGERRYIVKNVINAYLSRREDEGPLVIGPNQGTRFLVPEENTTNDIMYIDSYAYGDTLVWITTRVELFKYLDKKLNNY